MAGVWELAGEIVDAITFVTEYVVFTLFIFEEGMQIANRHMLNKISENKKVDLEQYMWLVFDFNMGYFDDFFRSYGILALYACNAYSSYLFSSMMVREWANIYLRGDRMQYSFPRTGLF